VLSVPAKVTIKENSREKSAQEKFEGEAVLSRAGLEARKRRRRTPTYHKGTSRPLGQRGLTGARVEGAKKIGEIGVYGKQRITEQEENQEGIRGSQTVGARATDASFNQVQRRRLQRSTSYGAVTQGEQIPGQAGSQSDIVRVQPTSERQRATVEGMRQIGDEPGGSQGGNNSGQR